jgi:DNA repair photolyase
MVTKGKTERQANTYSGEFGVNNQLYFCGLPFRLDSYSGCAHMCEYCFARSAELTNLSHIKRKKNQTLSIIPADPDEFKGKLNLALDTTATRADINIEWLRKKVPIHWGGMSDPFQPCELKYRVSKSYMDYINWYNYPVAISTKGSGLISSPEYIEMLKGGNYFVQITMLTDDPILTKIESGCPAPQDRLLHIQKLIDADIPVAIRIQPVIPNTVIEKKMPEFIYKLGKMGIKHIIVEGYKVQARQNAQMNYIWKVFPESINEYKYSDVKFEGFELLLPSWRKWQYIKPAIQAAHESGITYGAADNDMRSFGDTICCCGADNIKGFENFWRYQSSQAAMAAKANGQVSLDDMQQFWSGSDQEMDSGNILNNDMYMEVYGYQKGKAGENKEKAKNNGNMLACQAGKMRDDANASHIRTTAKYCVDWMWNNGGANSPENDVNLKRTQENGKMVYKWQNAIPMLENKQVKQVSMFDNF